MVGFGPVAGIATLRDAVPFEMDAPLVARGRFCRGVRNTC